MITQEQKQILQSRGYVVEDMQKEWGEGWWNGSFRFLKGDDFGNPMGSEESAWADAWQYDAQLEDYEQTQA